MIILKNNCIDRECKYATHTIEPYGDLYCSLQNKEVQDDIDITGCKQFKVAKNCLNCKHSIPTVYETGTIDDIEYRCPFQNNKLIYDDSCCEVTHNIDIPECNINKWEEE